MLARHTSHDPSPRTPGRYRYRPLLGGTEPGQRRGVGVTGWAGVADDKAGPLGVAPADGVWRPVPLQAVEGQASFGGPGDDVALMAGPGAVKDSLQAGRDPADT